MFVFSIFLTNVIKHIVMNNQTPVDPNTA